MDRWGPIVVVIAGAIMVGMGWMKWANPTVDFGTQVYVHWQVSEGKVLYKDINYYFGPLSSYVHAFLFNLFGPSLRLLTLFNLALVGLATFWVYQITRKMADSLTATLTGVSFLVVFALADYDTVGIFNYVMPYNYDITHGSVLSFLSFYLFYKYLTRPCTRLLSLLGIVAGLIFLTKVEIFVALFSSLQLGIVLALYFNKTPLLKELSVYLLSCLLFPILFWIYFSFHFPSLEAFQVLLAPWAYTMIPEIHAMPFYQWVSGMHFLSLNLSNMVVIALILAMVFGLLFLVEKHLHSYSAKYKWVHYTVGAFLLGPIFFWIDDIGWLELGRAFPLLVLALVVHYYLDLKRSLANKAPITIPLFSLVLSLFSLGMLLKMIWNTHVYHYGFVLAFPAFALILKFVIFDLSELLQLKTGHSKFYRVSASVLILIYIVIHGNLSYDTYRLKTFPVGSGPDTMVALPPPVYSEGIVTQSAIQHINENFSSSEKFPVLPSGPMINYMTRRANPFRFPAFTPMEDILYSENHYIKALQNDPPDHIVFRHINHWHLGARFFGEDYAQDLHQWIMANYHREKLFGDEPFSHDLKDFGENFGISSGILILKRNPA